MMQATNLTRSISGALGWVMSIGVAIAVAQQRVPQQGHGPLPVQNFQPLQLLILHLPVEGTTLTPKGHWAFSVGLAESNTLNQRGKEAKNTALVFDLETSRVTLGIKYGLFDRLEVGIDMPILFRWGGFLDRFIEGVERAVGKLNTDRKNGPVNTVRFHLQREGETVFRRGDSAVGPGDLVFGAKARVWNEGKRVPALATRLMLKVPTGSEDRLLGSGTTDIGIGINLQKTLWRLVLYGNLNAIFPGGALVDRDLDTHPFLTAAWGGEFLWTPHFSLLLQTEFYQSAFADAGVEELDRNLWELAFGFNYAVTPHLLWQLGGIQNLVVESGADFSLLSTLVYHF
ncbi:MAG: DUF3187 family protein [Nitrospinota bacterium]|nr:MAG: DUF3187 family protein [Nitrospinota bacterium]